MPEAHETQDSLSDDEAAPLRNSPNDPLAEFMNPDRYSEEKAVASLFVPAHINISIQNTWYTHEGITPLSIGHPIGNDMYAVCIPGIDSSTPYSSISPTTDVVSISGDDSDDLFPLSPILTANGILNEVNSPMKAQGVIAPAEEAEKSLPHPQLREESIVNVDPVGTWVQSHSRKMDPQGRAVYSIRDEKMGVWKWRYPCLQRDHRSDGQECRANYANHKDLVRHINTFGSPLMCDRCGKSMSRQDALDRHKAEKCEGRRGRGSRSRRK